VLTVYGCEQDEAELFHALAPRVGVVAVTTPDPVSAASAERALGGRSVSVGHTSALSRDGLRALRAAGVEHVTTRSIGVDHVDLDAAAELGIAVQNVPYSPDGVADFTVMLILMVVRGSSASGGHSVGAGSTPDRTRGRDLRDMTVGVVGTGRIGTAVIRRLQGFGCRLLACTERRSATTAARHVALDRLLRESDVVTLHTPLTPRNHHLLGAAELASMPRGALLVNTGRGALVDTVALVEALERGQLGGAGLDVVEGEDDVVDPGRRERSAGSPVLHRLEQLPNVVVTPHIAYRTERTLRETVETTLAQCLDFERSRPHGAAHEERHEAAERRDPVRRVLRGA
jgi:D-specific alpha-keto acid dehydrogenase